MSWKRVNFFGLSVHAYKAKSDKEVSFSKGTKFDVLQVWRISENKRLILLQFKFNWK